MKVMADVDTVDRFPSSWSGSHIRWGQSFRLCHVTTGKYLSLLDDKGLLLMDKEKADVKSTAFCFRSSKVRLIRLGGSERAWLYHNKPDSLSGLKMALAQRKDLCVCVCTHSMFLYYSLEAKFVKKKLSQVEIMSKHMVGHNEWQEDSWWIQEIKDILQWKGERVVKNN